MRLEALEIRNFRAFDRLDVESLGRVNLFVGKNSTGKTTLLEAIRMYIEDNPLSTMYDILTDREEFDYRNANYNASKYERDLELSFSSLFHGRPSIFSEDALLSGRYFAISGGPSTHTLRVGFSLLNRIEDEEHSGVRFELADPDLETFTGTEIPGIVIEGSQRRRILPFDRRMLSSTIRRREPLTTSDVVYLPSSGMPRVSLGYAWDSVALTEDEDLIVDALRLIVPGIDKLVLIESPNDRSRRILMARIKGFSGPVPFKSLGEGATSLLGMFLSILRARNGALLVDEVASGIHYSVQEKLWTLVLEFSHRFNVQVFATTHSWDAVSGLAKASKSDMFSSAVMFRLERGEDGSARSVRFDSDELKIAARDRIEVR